MEALIIFVKNPIIGKVKSRLAATIGDRKALEVYQRLLKRTRAVTQALDQKKVLFFSETIEHGDEWDDRDYQKEVQEGKGLGERMLKAFEKTFLETRGPVCIIGSDCYQLETHIIEEAFLQLQDTDVVIGPTEDGGYYLLGMKNFFPQLFDGIEWSSGKEFGQTMRIVRNMNLRAALLQTLIDVDTEEDLQSMD